MKSVLVTLIALSSISAFAAQTIECRQINKSGSIKKKGIELTVTMTSKKAGRIAVKGLTKDPTDNMNTLVVRSVNEGTVIRNGAPFTNIFLTPKNDDGMLDIQLQFDAHVMNKVFSNEKATFVIGSDSAEPETSWAYGYDMVCNGQKK